MATLQTNKWAGFRVEALPSGVPIELDLGSDDSSLASFSYTLGAAGAAILRGTPMESTWSNLITPLAQLSDGWDGEGAPAPSAAQISTALEFSKSPMWAGVSLPSIGPANDGGIVFEWDLTDGRSVYCYAREDRVEVAAFDATKDYSDVCLPARHASSIAHALVSAEAWTCS